MAVGQDTGDLHALTEAYLVVVSVDRKALHIVLFRNFEAGVVLVDHETVEFAWARLALPMLLLLAALGRGGHALRRCGAHAEGVACALLVGGGRLLALPLVD